MRTITFIILISCALTINAQDSFVSNYISLEKQIFIDKETKSANEFLYDFNSNTNEIAITFFSTKNQTDSICFYIYNTETDSISQEFYVIKNIWKSIIKNSTFGNIAISKNYIVIIIQYYIYVLDRKTGKLIVEQENKLKIDKVDFLDEKLFLYCNYNYHIKSREIKTQFYLLSIPDFTMLNETQPKFDVIQYSHISPNHWIDVQNNKILFSNTVNYKINLFDNNFKLKDTIYLPQNIDWKSPTKTDIKKIQKQQEAISIIFKIGKHENDKERIHGIYWISDSAFMVHIKKGVGNSIESLHYNSFFDIWKNKNGEWYLDKYHLKDKNFSEIKLENNEYSLFGCFNSIFTEKYIYNLTFKAPISLQNISTEEYLNQSKIYFYDNDPVFQIIKIKHILND